MYLSPSESSAINMSGGNSISAEIGYKHSAFIGSCKHLVWQAIRASSAAPYYLDDFSDGKLVCCLFPSLTYLFLSFSFLDIFDLPCLKADVNRWQDGAIVANNPTIFAMREAQLLWPDTKIDCLVSVGCGSVPTKVIKQAIL